MDSRTPFLANHTRRRQGLRSQAGSAYIVTLLALVVLTIVGLSVSLITQSEMLIGSNERTIQKTFYAANSGISIATAYALVASDYAAKTITLADPGTLLGLEHEVDLSPFYPILNAPCNLCEINNAGEYGSKQYYKNDYVVTSVATRKDAADTAIISRKTVSAMIAIQPQEMVVDVMEPLDDPDELAKIKL